ncbi:hypothetical protein [Nocardia sp. NPDC004860]|uniref:hypothetical protein n=1 Tax=Nocardia sp. NPDC004860 TaxID=3154557 RepID=UPI00339EDABF
MVLPGTPGARALPGLVDPESRSPSTSVLLPPAQAQRVMLIGGGSVDPYGPSTGQWLHLNPDAPAPV